MMAGATQDKAEINQVAILRAQNQELVKRIEQLEGRLRQESSRSEAAEKELDSMLHYISHDLRAPLRGIDGYSRALMEDYSATLDEMGTAYLTYISESSTHLNQLIEGLLRLSRIMRAEMQITTVDLSEIATVISQELQLKEPERCVKFSIQPGMIAQMDANLAPTMLMNLLENAFKFTSRRVDAHIEFSQYEENGQPVFFVQDNGVGFDMAYQDQLFQPFQRLHGQHEFEGIGLGLATAQRIIQRHNGRIWAKSALDQGATFFFEMVTTQANA